MRLLLPVILLLSACATTAPQQPPPPVSEAEMRETIGVLASDDFEGRMAGTPGADKAANYIAERFKDADVEAPAGGYFQAFQVDRKPKDPPDVTAKLPSGQRYFIVEQNRHGTFTSRNVVGKVPGRAPDGRAVIVMAHYDHLGICEPEGVADRICNGAVDNASGTAAMIAVAERVAYMHLDRDVWFVATCGEEWGLLGAKAFADNPPLPLATIIAGFNLDMIAIAGRGAPVAMVAPKGSMLQQMVRDAAAALGRPWDGDEEAQPFLQRQDGWALAQRGVPMIMAGGSFSNLKTLQVFLDSDYHAPSDELRPDSELGGAVDDANLHVELVRRAASRASLPSFAQVPHIGGR